MKATEGICALTGEQGRFRKAHIIPEALTRHDVPGQPFYQAGQGAKPVKRMTSWYDSNLVTARGEEILAGYDDWAIRTLRRHRMVWSGWRGNRLVAKDMVSSGALSVRQIAGADWLRLRLFYLSVLWRAAATSREEFAEVQLPTAHLERLRSMVLNGDPRPLNFFPIVLAQLSTRGPAHNQTPLSGTIDLGPEGPIQSQSVRIFRFFFDGLAAHVYRDQLPPSRLEGLGTLALGASETLSVTAIPFEGSFQARNLGTVMLETLRDHPAAFFQFSPRAFETGTARRPR